LAGAIEYSLGLWSTLTVYLADGRVEIDNNLVENAIRSTAIGKKNWLVVGDADAGERSAIIYTLFIPSSKAAAVAVSTLTLT